MVSCVVGTLVFLNTSYNDRQQAEQALANLAVALERDIDNQILLWDFSLQEYIQSKTPSTTDNRLQDAALSSFLATNKDMNSFMVLDTDGNAVDASVSPGSYASNFANKDYFLIHRYRAEVGLYFSQPFPNHMQNGEISVAISRRLPSDDGAFRGVALGILPLSHFEHLFKSIELGSQGSVTVFKLTGGIFLNYPVSVADTRNVSTNALGAAEAVQPSSGSVVVADGPNGVKRLHVFRRTGKLPLLFDVAVSFDEIQKMWSTGAISVGFILFGLCCINLTLCCFLRHEHTRRLQREIQLVDDACKKFAIERALRVKRHQETSW